MSESPPTTTGAERLFVAAVLVASLMQGLIGIAKYGYCGQDFEYHHAQLVSFPLGFSYAFTNPPGLYALGQLVSRFVSQEFVLEATAFILLSANVLSLWLLYFILRRLIRLPELRWAALLVVAFVPFRVVHSIVFSADAVSLPVFVLVAWLSIQLFEKDRCASCLWVIIGGVMTLGMLFKYTFVGLLPVLTLLALHQLVYVLQGRVRLAVAAAAAISLAVPSLTFWMQMELSRRTGGMAAVSQWLQPEDPRQMRIRDIVSVKSADVDLLGAPQYFQDKVYTPQRYSYPGLLHLAMFTDLLNYFQRPPSLQAHLTEHRQNSVGIPRRPLARALSPLAVVASLPLSLAALAGTVVVFAASMRRLLINSGPAPLSLAIVTTLALGFYAPIILNITSMKWAYEGGYWLPRLVMPTLITLFILAFVQLDRMLVRRQDKESTILIKLCLAYAAIMSVVYVAIT